MSSAPSSLRTPSGDTSLRRGGSPPPSPPYMVRCLAPPHASLGLLPYTCSACPLSGDAGASSVSRTGSPPTPCARHMHQQRPERWDYCHRADIEQVRIEE